MEVNCNAGNFGTGSQLCMNPNESSKDYELRCKKLKLENEFKVIQENKAWKNKNLGVKNRSFKKAK